MSPVQQENVEVVPKKKRIRWNLEKFVAEAKKVHNDKFDYSKVDF